MDVEAVVEGLNRALALQRRSVLLYSLAGASTIGPLAAGIADRYELFAGAELEDAGRLAAKLVSLGGEPTDDVAPLSWEEDAAGMIDVIADAEAEALEALQKVIAPAGDEPEGEALEHLLEHAIMRKQQQVDFLKRVRRGL
jgi:bacterioferritin (cytochrome b1)